METLSFPSGRSEVQVLYKRMPGGDQPRPYEGTVRT